MPRPATYEEWKTRHSNEFRRELYNNLWVDTYGRATWDAACEAHEEVVQELVNTQEWLESFSMPPTSTIEEKQERLIAIQAVLTRLRGY